MTVRAGAREWFGDHVFVEAQDDHKRSGYGTAFAAHVGGATVLIAVLVTQAVHNPIVRVGSSLVMPAMVSAMPRSETPAPASRVPKPSGPEIAPRPAEPPAPPAGAAAQAPIEAPSAIAPETGDEGGGDGVDGGVAGGVPGGVAGGGLDGTSASGLGSGSGSAGPYRLGGGITPPRKIRDVKPVYPMGALSARTRGAVIIEATIGADGKVQQAAVVRSIAALDQAALDAVRQWEYAPSLLDGVAVAVIVMIVVNFAIQ